MPGRTSRRRRRGRSSRRRHDWPRARTSRRCRRLVDRHAVAWFIFSTVPRLCSSSRRCRGRVHPGAGAVKIGKRSPCVWPCRAARFGVVSRAASHLSAAWLAIGTAENEWRLGCADKSGGGIPVVLARRRRQNGRGLLRVVALPVGSMWRPAFTGRVQFLRARQFVGLAFAPGASRRTSRPAASSSLRGRPRLLGPRFFCSFLISSRLRFAASASI